MSDHGQVNVETHGDDVRENGSNAETDASSALANEFLDTLIYDIPDDTSRDSDSNVLDLFGPGPDISGVGDTLRVTDNQGTGTDSSGLSLQDIVIRQQQQLDTLMTGFAQMQQQQQMFMTSFMPQQTGFGAPYGNPYIAPGYGAGYQGNPNLGGFPSPYPTFNNPFQNTNPGFDSNPFSLQPNSITDLQQFQQKMGRPTPGDIADQEQLTGLDIVSGNDLIGELGTFLEPRAQMHMATLLDEAAEDIIYRAKKSLFTYGGNTIRGDGIDAKDNMAEYKKYEAIVGNIKGDISEKQALLRLEQDAKRRIQIQEDIRKLQNNLVEKEQARDITFQGIRASQQMVNLGESLKAQAELIRKQASGLRTRSDIVVQ